MPISEITYDPDKKLQAGLNRSRRVVRWLCIILVLLWIIVAVGAYFLYPFLIKRFS